MFRLLTLLVGFFLLLVVGSGAYQRFLPNEVQSCSAFSECYSQVLQLFAQDIITIQKIVWAVHSFSASAIVVCLGIMLLSIVTLKVARIKLAIWTLVLSGLVGLQVYLGMHSYLMGTQALSQMAHYLLSAVALYVVMHIYLSSNSAYIKREALKKSWLLISAIFILAVQLAFGAWLTVNNAGLVCGGFPQCLNTWWPQVNFLNAFNFLAPLSFEAKVAVHWLHRLLSIVVFILLTGVMLTATGNRIKQVRWAGIAVSWLLLVQIAAGIALVKLMMPAWVAVVHSVTAMLLMLPLLLIRFHSRYQKQDLELKPAGVDVKGEQDVVVKTPIVEQGVVAVEPEVVEPESLYIRLKSQLGKTRTGLGAALSLVSLANRKIDQDLLEEIETSLLMADVGMDVTTEIIAKLEESVEKHQLKDAAALSALLKQQLLDILEPVSQPLVIPEKEGPFVILVVGINGVGKTTTIGKLAQRLQQQGHSVMLAAGDTFRAAAVEQLQVWGKRNKIHVVAQHTGADSASVIYDGVQSAQAKGIDVLIADTAGRLHTKTNLMEELKKVERIISKLDDTAPHETLLVLDAGTGQNALSQAEHFNNTVPLTGLALTKLDGTAKGGMIFALAKKVGIPIRFLGVGEGINDLQDFNAEQFVDALFNQEQA